MTRHWMPFYVADYFAGTYHLNTLQHGAYLLLILHYWSKGGLPKDEDSVRQVTRLDVRSWSKNRVTLNAFFHDGWKHARLDKELAQAAEISKANSAKAYKRHHPGKPSADDRQPNGTTPSPSPTQTLPLGESRDPPPKAENGVLVPKDWTPNERNVEVAHDAGLTDAQIDAEAARFRSYNRARGVMFTDLDAAWEAWCQKAKPAAPKPDAADDGPPKPIDWDGHARFWAKVGRWPKGIGPEPGQGGCRCPREFLEKNDIDAASGEVRRKAS